MVSIPYLYSSNYEEVAQSPAFVDKTMLIKNLLTNDKHRVLITAPRGFGKSTNLDMVKRFLEININQENWEMGSAQDSINYKFFAESRLISKEEGVFDSYFAKFGVIRISLKDIYRNSMSQLMRKYGEALIKTYKEHTYLINSRKITDEEKRNVAKYYFSTIGLRRADYEIGISVLAKIISSHCDNCEIFVLVDDYDQPILDFIVDANVTDKFEPRFFSFYANIFNNILNANNGIHRVLITGRTTLGTSLFMHDSVQICRFLCNHPFADFYGITINELDVLLTTFCSGDSTIKSSILAYYRHMSFELKEIFATRSIMHYLDSKKFEDYQKYSEVMSRVKEALFFPIIRYVIEKAFQDSGSFLTSWNSFFITPYLPTNINQLHLMCTREEFTASLQHCLTYIRLLAEFGLFKIRLSTQNDKISIKVANDFANVALRQAIDSSYSSELNEQLILGAKHLNNLSVSSGYEYFSVFEQIFKRIYMGYFGVCHRDLRGPSIHLPLFDLVGKSDYYFIMELSEDDSMCFVYNKIGVMCLVKYNTNPRDTLQRLLWSVTLTFAGTPQYDVFDQLEEKIYMGINFDKSLSVSFEVCSNTRNITFAEHYGPH